MNLREDVADGKKDAEYEIFTLKDKVDDLENCSRRNNLCLVGFPEGVEGRDTVSFVEEWLSKIIGVDQERPFETERAYRMLQRRPAECERPKAIVIKLLHFRDTVSILNAAQEKKELTYGNSKIMIFRDMSTTLYKKKQAFAPLRRRLRDHNISYSMQYPATLRVYLLEGA